MKTKDIQKLKDKNIAELQKTLKEAREELRALKFDLVAGKVKNIKLIQETKKKIARILTFIKGNEATK
ncbi:MAG: 50S ribosomal protein L29 [Candidatus Colwellbacteria bacterium]|nr:50S ribosomal protein L29 [Candidatus Colwellbacteria bacterium]